jgi:UDP-GlcNAc3NAcA epimerase
MIGIEHVLQSERPDLIVVYVDTNSTLAGALAATKLRIPCAHVEAGLRSFNREMPEELNRVIADHISDLLLAPTRTAMTNLEREGLAERAVLTGDLMYDAVIHYRALAQHRSTNLQRLQLQQGAYGMVTLHRAENTDDRARLAVLLGTLNEIAREKLPLVFPVHPRTTARIAALLPGWRPDANFRLIEPVGYLDSVNLLANASICMTDSGGLQKEAFFLGCPCITLRPETEWIETVEAHANIITDCDTQRILAAFERWQGRYPKGQAAFSALAAEEFGAGYAAGTILLNLLKFLDKRRSTSSGPDVASGDLFSDTKSSGDKQ